MGQMMALCSDSRKRLITHVKLERHTSLPCSVRILPFQYLFGMPYTVHATVIQ